jgi:hypothetical protein
MRAATRESAREDPEGKKGAESVSELEHCLSKTSNLSDAAHRK